MPIMEIDQGGRASLIYGLDTPHRRTFLVGDTIIGATNKCPWFLKDKLIFFQDGHMKYRARETNRLNWALRSFLPVCIFFLCLSMLIFFPQYEAFGVILVIASFMIADSFFYPQYAIFKGDVEIGYVRTARKDSIGRAFSINDDIYRIYVHSHEQYSLFKNGVQIALYKRKLENYRSRYHIYYDPERSVEVIQLFCLWIDLFYYDDVGGRIILKTFRHFDKHPEYTVWRPKDL